MPTPTLDRPDSSAVQARDVLRDLFVNLPSRNFDVRFWDGSIWPGDVSPPKYTLVLKHPGSLRRMFWPPKPLTFGEAYVYGDFDVEGDMLAFQDLCNYLTVDVPKIPLLRRLSLAWRLWRLPRVERTRTGREVASLPGRAHSRERDRAAIHYHYDQPDVLFEKLMGPAMLYTSAIFDSPDESLEAAQHRKLDAICRKLRIRPGDRLLDIGCGWSFLGVHAVKHYGAQVVGVTLSEKNLAWSRNRIRNEGLEGRVSVELLDYRDLPENEPFDHIACIEVAEHFGADQHAPYFQKCHRLLKPGGGLLHQQISATYGLPEMAAAFSHRFIFPDGELVALNFLLKQAEENGLEIRDVEGLREHYVLTLKHWLANLEANEQEVTAATDEATYRSFRLYLGGAQWGFLHNVYGLFQILLVKPDGHESHQPLRRHV